MKRLWMTEVDFFPLVCSDVDRDMCEFRAKCEKGEAEFGERRAEELFQKCRPYLLVPGYEQKIVVVDDGKLIELSGVWTVEELLGFLQRGRGQPNPPRLSAEPPKPERGGAVKEGSAVWKKRVIGEEVREEELPGGSLEEFLWILTTGSDSTGWGYECYKIEGDDYTIWTGGPRWEGVIVKNPKVKEFISKYHMKFWKEEHESPEEWPEEEEEMLKYREKKIREWMEKHMEALKAEFKDLLKGGRLKEAGRITKVGGKWKKVGLERKDEAQQRNLEIPVVE